MPLKIEVLEQVKANITQCLVDQQNLGIDLDTILIVAELVSQRLKDQYKYQLLVSQAAAPKSEDAPPMPETK